MEMVNQFNSAIWISFVTPIFLISCLYFTLSFLQYMKSGNEQLINYNKWGAVLSLAFALLVPAFYNVYFYFKMIQ